METSLKETALELLNTYLRPHGRDPGSALPGLNRAIEQESSTSQVAIFRLTRWSLDLARLSEPQLQLLVTTLHILLPTGQSPA